MSGSVHHPEVLDDECEKYLAEQGMYSIGDHKDEAGLVDIYTIDGELVAVHLPRDISVALLTQIVVLETGNASLTKQLESAKLITGEYDKLIRHMDAGGDFFEFMRSAPQL
jgi:hypothetical protein